MEQNGEYGEQELNHSEVTTRKCGAETKYEPARIFPLSGRL